MKFGLDLAAVTVAALEAVQHGGDGEGQQQEPDDDGDLGGFLQDFDKVPSAEMHHVEIAVDGQHDEEGDAGASVEEQHEEHGLADHRVAAASLVVLVVVDLGREAGHQQEISNHDIEEEDAFVLPELEPKSQRKHQNEHRRRRRLDVSPQVVVLWLTCFDVCRPYLSTQPLLMCLIIMSINLQAGLNNKPGHHGLVVLLPPPCTGLPGVICTSRSVTFELQTISTLLQRFSLFYVTRSHITGALPGVGGQASASEPG